MYIDSIETQTQDKKKTTDENEDKPEHRAYIMESQFAKMSEYHRLFFTIEGE